MMNKAIPYLGSLLLAEVLTAPLALQAQDRDDHRDRDHDRDKAHRMYDRDRKDYRNWNSDEENSYRE